MTDSNEVKYCLSDLKFAICIIKFGIKSQHTNHIY